MKYIAILQRAKMPILSIARIFAWLCGAQVAIMFAMAAGAGRPMPYESGPFVRFVLAMAVLFLLPPFIKLLAQRARRAAA